MSQLEFNVKAKFVYTKLLPLLQEAARDVVEGVNYCSIKTLRRSKVYRYTA